MKLGGCGVVIKYEGTNGRATKVVEHGVEVSDNGKEIACYIASMPGEDFWIEYHCKLNYCPPNTDFTADVFFGGVFDGGWIAPDPSPRAKMVVGEIWTSRREDKFYKLGFSMPELIDGETPSSVDPDSLGEIDVRLGFVMDSEAVERPTGDLSTVGPVKVNEKDKKPGAHCAGPMSEVSTGIQECSGPVFFGVAKDPLIFTFICRSKEWLEAEGIIKPRRKSKRKPENDSEVPPPPKPEPTDEVVDARGVLTEGAEVLSQSRRSPTALSYADGEPAAQSGGRKRPAPQSTGQDEQRPASSDFVTPERPRKAPRLSGNPTFTTDSETRGSITTKAPVKDCSRSKVKVERESLVSKVKVEEGGSVPKVKEEVGVAMVNDLKGLKAEEKELDGQIFQLEMKRAKLRGKIAALPTAGIGSGTASPQPGVKTERESVGRLVPPEVIDLTD